MNGLILLTGSGCIGMFLHYAKKAMRGQLWQGNTEPNPFKLQFWTDFYLYMIVEHPGATAAAVIASAGSAFVLANTMIDVETATPLKLIIAGTATGFIADSTMNRD